VLTKLVPEGKFRGLWPEDIKIGTIIRQFSGIYSKVIGNFYKK
jgi:hypothetical protein